MRLLLIGTLLFSGGGAVAMQNDAVQERVEGIGHNVRQIVQRRTRHGIIEHIKEDGFPYPPQQYLDTLTEEQEAIIMTTIDQINVEYDWANMTDEEIKDALLLIKEEMSVLYDELGLDYPEIGQYVRRMARHRMRNRVADHVGENGIPYPPEAYLETLTEEQRTAITDQIELYNETYDWANMTDQEIFEALQLVRTEMSELKEELGIEAPFRASRGRHCYEEETTDEEIITE